MLESLIIMDVREVFHLTLSNMYSMLVELPIKLHILMFQALLLKLKHADLIWAKLEVLYQVDPSILQL